MNGISLYFSYPLSFSLSILSSKYVLITIKPAIIMEIINTNFVSNIMDIEIHQIKIAKYVGCRIILYGPSLHTIWLLSNCTRDVDSRKVFTIIAFKDIIVTGIYKIIPIANIIPGLSA